MYINGKYEKPNSNHSKPNKWLSGSIAVLVTLLLFPLIRWITPRNKKSKKSRSIIIKF